MSPVEVFGVVVAVALMIVVFAPRSSTPARPATALQQDAPQPPYLGAQSALVRSVAADAEKAINAKAATSVWTDDHLDALADTARRDAQAWYDQHANEDLDPRVHDRAYTRALLNAAKFGTAVLTDEPIAYAVRYNGGQVQLFLVDGVARRHADALDKRYPSRAPHALIPLGPLPLRARESP